jgi:hypothetical protein
MDLELITCIIVSTDNINTSLIIDDEDHNVVSGTRTANIFF